MLETEELTKLNASDNRANFIKELSTKSMLETEELTIFMDPHKSRPNYHNMCSKETIYNIRDQKN